MKHIDQMNTVKRIKKIAIFVAIVIVCIALGLASTVVALMNFVTYEYTSTSVVYVIRTSDESEFASGIYQNLLANKEVATDFSTFLNSEAAFNNLKARLGSDLTWLYNHKFVPGDDKLIVAVNESESRLINISATCDNPYDAAKIANEAVRMLDEFSELIYGVDLIQVVESAEPITKPSSPERKITIAMGAVVGFVVGLCIVVAIMWKGKKTKTSKTNER